MNRKLLLAAVVLLILMGLKYAFGQEELSGWDPTTVYPSPDDYVIGVMMAAPMFGLLIGIVKVASQRSRRPILEPIRLK